MARRHPRCDGSGTEVFTHQFGSSKCPYCEHVVSVHNHKLVNHWWVHNRYYGRRRRKTDVDG